MKNIHPLICRKTSVSLPDSAYRRLLAAKKMLSRNGIRFSDHEIYRRLFKEYLKNWRGRGLKTNGLRRYNREGQAYAIHPLYINQVLYASLWQRALHSGESISRMLDVAIRVYLPRLLETLLCAQDLRNSRYWNQRLARRKRQYADFFINYTCHTENNNGRILEYCQKAEIISKADLSVMEIWQLLHQAA